LPPRKINGFDPAVIDQQFQIQEHQTALSRSCGC
jgi:hypothetical protein